MIYIFRQYLITFGKHCQAKQQMSCYEKKNTFKLKDIRQTCCELLLSPPAAVFAAGEPARWLADGSAPAGRSGRLGACRDRAAPCARSHVTARGEAKPTSGGPPPNQFS